MSATTSAILSGDKSVRQEGKPKSIVFLPRSPYTRPYDDISRDIRLDALRLREIIRRQGGVVAAGTRRELGALAWAARLPFAQIDRCPDYLTWTNFGAPDGSGEGLYHLIDDEPPEAA